MYPNPNMNGNPPPGYYTNAPAPAAASAPTSTYLAAAPSYPRTQPQPVASSSAAAAAGTTKQEDFDFLDELEFDSDDSGSGDDYAPDPKAKKGQFDQGLIKGALKPSRSVQYSCNDINWWINAGGIDLNAEYQRDVVWTEARQEGLIDSLFLNYFVPPVLFSVERDDDTGEEKRTCMDGKQRLTTIHKFMSGQIAWKPSSGPSRGTRYWYVLNGKRRGQKNQELPALERGIFERKQIVCAEFDALTDGQQREIFQRVQLGLALSPAEKLQALNTPLTNYVSMVLKKHVTAEEGIERYYSDFKKDRGSAWQNVANLIFVVEAWEAGKKEKHGLGASTLAPYLKSLTPVEDHLKRKIDKVFDIYVEIMQNYQDIAVAPSKTRLAPVEFVFFGLAIHVLRHYYDIPSIAKKLGEMRVWIREQSKDIRSNGVICKQLYNWIHLQPLPKRVKNGRPRDSDEEEAQYQRKRARLEAEDGDYVDHQYR